MAMSRVRWFERPPTCPYHAALGESYPARLGAGDAHAHQCDEGAAICPPSARSNRPVPPLFARRSATSALQRKSTALKLFDARCALQSWNRRVRAEKSFQWICRCPRGVEAGRNGVRSRTASACDRWSSAGRRWSISLLSRCLSRYYLIVSRIFIFV